MENSTEVNRELALLESIEQDPDVTQANLASQLGVAVGTINWHIKRLIEKGYVKIKRAERKKLRYIITPEGIAMRAHLTVDFIEQQFNLYRNTRQRVKDHINDFLEGDDKYCIVSSEPRIVNGAPTKNQRYLENRLREEYELTGVPIQIYFRKK